MSDRDLTSSEAMDRQYLDQALKCAREAAKLGEVPVGAIVINEEGHILAQSHNLRETHANPIAHAELIVLQKAAQALGAWRLEGATVYVTLEPCPMCLAGLQQSRVKRVVYGASDPKGGALSLGWNINEDARTHHRFPVDYVPVEECGLVMSNFFRSRRKGRVKGRTQ